MIEGDDYVIVNSCPDSFIPQFAILIAIGNESNISSLVSQIYDDFVKNCQFTFEIIVSGYCSTDNEKELKYLSTKVPLKASISHNDKPYPAQIKNGLHLVDAPYVIISDFDGQLNSEDFFMLRKRLDQLSNPREVVIVGTRKVVIEGFQRTLIFGALKILASIIFDLDSDSGITAPFKLMSTSIARATSSECIYLNEYFWVEFVLRARNKNLKVTEVEVKSTKGPIFRGIVKKKSRIPVNVLNTLIGLVRLKKELSGKSFVVSVFHTKSIRRLITFALIGSSAALLTLFLTWLGVNLGLFYILSAALGIQISIVWAFLLHDRITFKDKIDSYQLSKILLRFLKYNVSSLGGQAINLSSLFLLTNTGLFYLYSEMVAILVAFAFNYTLSRKWVWARK